VSPLAGFTMAYQDVLYHGRIPGGFQILMLCGWTIVMIGFGHAVFRRYRGQFAEVV